MLHYFCTIHDGFLSLWFNSFHSQRQQSQPNLDRNQNHQWHSLVPVVIEFIAYAAFVTKTKIQPRIKMQIKYLFVQNPIAIISIEFQNDFEILATQQ